MSRRWRSQDQVAQMEFQSMVVVVAERDSREKETVEGRITKVKKEKKEKRKRRTKINKRKRRNEEKETGLCGQS